MVHLRLRLRIVVFVFVVLLLLACNFVFFHKFSRVVPLNSRRELVLSSIGPPPSIVKDELKGIIYGEEEEAYRDDADWKEDELSFNDPLWPDLSLMPWAAEASGDMSIGQPAKAGSEPPPIPIRQLPNLTSPKVINQQDWPLWWHAPFFDRTSFGHEATALLLGGIRSGALNESSVWVGLTQSSCETAGSGLDEADFDLLNQALGRADIEQAAIVVCHSLPPFWSRPLPHWPSCHPCPPLGYIPAVAIGRAMAETFPYNVEFVNECRRMDEIWVPSKFSRDTLIASGVEPEKLRILPIAVDVSAFDPVAFAPLKLPFGERMLGGSRRLEMPTWEQMQSQEITAEIIPELDFLSFDTEADYQRHEVKTWGSASPQEKFDSPPPTALAKIILTQTRKRKAQSKHRTRPNKTLVNRRRGKPYVFVSVFKWEMRKGWDILVEAYFREFKSDDDVELYILTKPFADSDPSIVKSWVPNKLNITEGELDKRAPSMYLSSSHIDSWTYKRLLRASDCFVLPSRGEGWGMPATEAMSMGLPVIVTNWSGTADIVDESVGSLLPFKLTKVPESEPWWFYDAEWADADVTALRKAMRHYYDHSDESARKGRTARQRMIDFYSPAAVSRALVRELERIKSKLRSKECKSCFNSTYVAKPGDELKPIGYSDEDIFLVKPSERETRRRILEAQSQSLLSFGSKDPHRKLNLWLVVICILLPFSVMIICTLLSHK